MIDYEISAEAILLAEKANEEYDQRISAARKLASILNTMPSGAIDQSIVDVAADNAEQEFNQADKRFDTYLNAAAVLMPSQANIEYVATTDASEQPPALPIELALPDEAEPKETAVEDLGVELSHQLENKAEPLSSSALGRKLGVSHVTIKTAAKELAEDLGEVTMRIDSRGREYPEYTEAQQELIRQKLERNRSLFDVAPDEVQTVYGIAEQLGVSDDMVKSAIDSLGDQLGEIGLYRHGKSKTTGAGFTPEQQDLIRVAVAEKKSLFEPAPEDVVRPSSLANILGVSDNTIKREIKRLGDELGEIRSYRFATENSTPMILPGFNKEQQEKIRQSLEERGLFVDVAPEGVLSAKAVAKSLDVDYYFVRRAVKELGDSLGETKRYRHEHRRGPIWAGYTLEQQEMIKNHRLIKNYLERRSLNQRA